MNEVIEKSSQWWTQQLQLGEKQEPFQLVLQKVIALALDQYGTCVLETTFWPQGLLLAILERLEIEIVDPFPRKTKMLIFEDRYEIIDSETLGIEVLKKIQNVVFPLENENEACKKFVHDATKNFEITE